MQYLNVVKLTKHELQYGQCITAMFILDNNVVVEKAYDKIGDTWFESDLTSISNRTLSFVLSDLQQQAKAYQINIYKLDENTEKYLWHTISNFDGNTPCTPHKVSYAKNEYVPPQMIDLLSCGKVGEYVLDKQELEELRDMCIYIECANNCCKNLKRLLKL